MTVAGNGDNWITEAAELVSLLLTVPMRWAVRLFCLIQKDNMKLDLLRRRATKRRLASAMAGVVLAAVSGAHAQGPQPARSSAVALTSSAEQVCPPPLPLPAGLLALTDKMLVPGTKFDLTAITPEAMQQIIAVQMEMSSRQASDWANLCHYAEENAAVIASGKRPLAVLLGDSITENWIRADPALFNSEVLDRGISGQTTPQMVLRVFPDVIALRPRVMHIMAGTNDISALPGPSRARPSSITSVRWSSWPSPMAFRSSWAASRHRKAS